MTPSVPGGGGTITVEDASGYPASGKFDIVIDRGLSNEESVTISSRSGTTFTIGSRGYDGTVATSHTGGEATVELDLSATLVQLLIDHVDDVETAPHSTKLPVGTTAGHDITARHQFGAALGTPGTPTALTPDIAGAAGTAAQAARADHAHNVPAAIASDISTTNTEGSAASFARSDHGHQLGTGAIDTPGQFAAGIIANGSMMATGQKLTYVQAGDPGAVGDGSIWSDTTNRQVKIRNAANTAWEIVGEVITPWTDYTPTFANITLGNGTRYGRFTRLGKTVVGVAGLRFGSTTSVSGQIGVSLPSTADFTGTNFVGHAEWLGAVRGSDVSANQRWAAVGRITDGDAGNIVQFATAGVGGWDSNTPFTWANTDLFAIFFMYEEV